MGKDHATLDDDVVVATVQTLYNRLDKYPRDHFDLLISDECFTGDVEVLTDEGFVRFDELGDQKVAQVHDDLTHSFVNPIRKVKKHYKGDLVMSRVDASSRKGGVWVGMTPKHEQVFYNNETKRLETMYIKDFKQHWDNRYRVIDHLVDDGSKDTLTPMEKLYIAAQADGAIISSSDSGYRYRFTFSKQRKIDRLLKLCDKAGVPYLEGYKRKFDNPNWNDSESYLITLDKDCTLFTNFFDYGLSHSKANDIVQEISHWDGYRKNDNYIDYDCGIKNNSSFINYVGFVAGWHSTLNTIPKKNKRYMNNYRVTLTKRITERPFKPANKFNIDTKPHDDLVYCVTVPTSKIIVRKDGRMFVTGNCQEAKGKQYEETIKYFTPKYSVGLSGTPFRLDGQKLTDGLFDKIAYQKDIKWGIENGYLCDVDAVRCFVDFDLSGVRSSGGDFNINDLEEAMMDTSDAIADAFYKYSKGRPTLIFASGIKHAKAIAERIEGARVIIGDTPQEERDEIFDGFENEEIPCIVSVDVMTQGVDLPISTVGIFAKPTKSVGRYQQQVGRILRTHPKKDRALIVDCIGVSNLGLCTAPSILGINMDLVPEERHDEVEGDLMEMEELIEVISDTPTSWIRNAKHVKLWAKENKVKTNQVNYLLTPKGEMVVSLPERVKVSLPPPDMLGNIDATKIKGLSPELHKWGLEYYGDTWELQRGLDAIHHYLARNYGEQDKLWDLKKVRSWGKKPATPAQIAYLMRRLKGDVPNPLTRGEAAQILQMLDLRK